MPRLGTWKDANGNKQPCPSARSWDLVDQDQSDNLLTTYLITPNGQLAQNTARNRAQFPGATVLTNPSDERLLSVFVDPALGCTPWTAPDLTDPGHKVPALALNELQAGAFQLPPQALIPAGDPFAQNPPYSGIPDLDQINAFVAASTNRRRRTWMTPVRRRIAATSSTSACPYCNWSSRSLS